MPKGGSPSQDRSNSGSYNGSRGGGLGGRGNDNRGSDRDKFQGRETRGFHGGGINTSDFQDRPQANDNRDGNGGRTVTKTPGPAKPKPGGGLLGGDTLGNAMTGAMVGGMVAGAPGMLAGGLLGAAAGALGGGSLGSNTGSRVGRDMRDSGRNAGDSDDRSVLRPAEEDPKTEPPKAEAPVVTPPSVDPGDPDNVGMRGRRRRMNTLLGGTVGTSLLSPAG